MAESHGQATVHSIWPLLLAAGITLVMVGVISSLIVSLVGVALMLVALGGWVQQNRAPHPETDVDGEDGWHE